MTEQPSIKTAPSQEQKESETPMVGATAETESAANSNLSEIAKDFLKEEQKQRRQEIDFLIEKTESDQKSGLIITGAYWAWIITNGSKLLFPINIVAICIPTIIMAFFFFRYWSLHNSINGAAEYTLKVEELFDVPTGYGWETHIKDKRDNGQPNYMFRSTIIFWVALIFTNIILGIFWVKYKG